MEMHFNWIAYAVAVVAQMMIGYIWFHPAVMGKMWAKVRGIPVEEIRPKNPGLVYGLTVVYTLFITMFFMLNVTGFGQEDVKFHTIQHGLFHAVGFGMMVILPLLGTPTLFEGRPKEWMIVQGGYWFVRAAVAMSILSFWR
ncbi:MAG: DUF1761 domain-containing protein [Bacteroidetes bacterium]|jgi:hypothetical protein|nr:DUF1761 domain-containing protein [Bacteroidota bacterium]MBP6314344.1 DUF1761 domain-containing protein [Chitinophagaceae bacterium]